MSKEMREHINKIKNFGQFLNENNNSYFYHITPTINIENIKKIGLKSPVYLTDSIEKSILWRNIKIDEMLENGENIINDWVIITLTNINKDNLKHKNYYDVDFLDFPSPEDFKNKILLCIIECKFL